MNKPAVYKDDKTGLGRVGRFFGSLFSPAAYAHAFRLLNFYRFTHTAELAKARKGTGLRIAPTASFANGQNIEIGNHVRIGANASIWAGPGVGKVILGDHTMIGPNTMLTAANYRFGDGSPVNDQAMDEADITVGEDVWIGANVMVLPGVTIGDKAIIGAGAVLRSDVPPGGVVVGAASELVGRRFLENESEGNSEPQFEEVASSDVRAWLLNHGSLSEERLILPLEECGLDSFDLITLRTALEQAHGTSIPDRDWAAIRRLEDIARFSVLKQGPSADPAPPKTVAKAVEVGRTERGQSQALGLGSAMREFSLNMPQMALAGLSESWIFKELGDLHWAMITDFLGTTSGAIADDTGSRLYATFTRIMFEAEPSLRSFNENDSVSMTSNLERFGASFFFGDHEVNAPGAKVRARTMSTFAKYGERGKNTSLMKGAPTLPEARDIPVLSEFPDFGTEYRERRAQMAEGEPLFQCEYEQLGPHDINGVGLLYFAAYPIIFDICVGKLEGPEFLLSHSTASKDVCYFANAEPTETLIFRIHEREATDGLVRHVASLSRKSDDKRMAEIIGVKRYVGIHVPE